MIILFKVGKQSWFINQVTRFHHLFMYIFINFTRIPYIGILQKIPKQNTNRCHNHGTWHKVGWWVFRRNAQTASVLRGALQKTCWDRKFTACLLKPMIAVGNSSDFSHFLWTHPFSSLKFLKGWSFQKPHAQIPPSRRSSGRITAVPFSQ